MYKTNGEGMKKTSLIPALFFAVSLPVCLGGCGKAEPYRHDSFTFDTFVSFAIYETSEGISAEEVCTGAVGMLNELDDTLSRTKADSEISKINKNAGSGKVTVDISTYNLLKSCTELSRLTDGAFDITLGDISDMWGFGKENPPMPDSDELKKLGMAEFFRSKTGLVLDAYFSATKLRWLLDNAAGARERAEKGELLFGTVDSWIIWKLTGGKVHVTDYSNASRTMLFNIHKLEWDEELLALFDIPGSMMPEVKSSSEVYGYTTTTMFAHKVPIAGIAGDQQAALFGQMCTEPGMVKNTYGTGCFLLMNSGDKPVYSKNNLLATIAWKIGGEVTYALEGSIFVGGAIVQWLRDGLGIVRSSSEIEALASRVPDNGGVFFVPALTGLGAPYWNQYARGAISGISRGTTAAHIARAALEGIAYQTMDVVNAMQRDAEIELKELRVDGGAAANNLLMQFQADVLGTDVIRPKIIETTALGAAYLAGLAVGYWKDLEEIKQQWQVDKHFEPTAEQKIIHELKEGWRDAIDRVIR